MIDAMLRMTRQREGHFMALTGGNVVIPVLPSP